MSGNKLLSVCCLGYRHAPYIRDCIKSLWNGGYPEIEIIAMDDGSNDGSVEILKELQATSPCPFTILYQENTGNIPANFNKLFMASRGDFVLFTALDDQQLPNILAERMQRLLNDDSLAFCAHTKLFILDGVNKLRPDKTMACGLQADPKLFLEIEREKLGCFYIQGAIFRREIVAAVGCFTPNLLGDDIVLRTKIFFYLLAHPNLTFALLDEPGFIYRWHEGNVHRKFKRQIELVLQYYDKFWSDYPFSRMVKRWMIYALNHVDYDEIVQVFAISSRASTLLKNAEVRKALQNSAVRAFLKANQQDESSN